MNAKRPPVRRRDPAQDAIDQALSAGDAAVLRGLAQAIRLGMRGLQWVLHSFLQSLIGVVTAMLIAPHLLAWFRAWWRGAGP
jgi:hypothetical protein